MWAESVETCICTPAEPRHHLPCQSDCRKQGRSAGTPQQLSGNSGGWWHSDRCRGGVGVGRGCSGARRPAAWCALGAVLDDHQLVACSTAEAPAAACAPPSTVKLKLGRIDVPSLPMTYTERVGCKDASLAAIGTPTPWGPSPTPVPARTRLSTRPTPVRGDSRRSAARECIWAPVHRLGTAPDLGSKPHLWG